MDESAEMPRELALRQAEVCKEEAKTELSECPASGEREVKSTPMHVARRTSSLPWKLELTRGEREAETGVLAKTGLAEFGESGTAEGHSTKCYPKEGTAPASFEKVPAGCVAIDIIFPQVPYEWVVYGTQEIWTVNGAGNGLDASHLEWIQPGGTFFSSKGIIGEAEIEPSSKVKLSGAGAQELITAK